MIVTLLREFEIRSTFSINLFCYLFIFSTFIWSLVFGSRRPQGKLGFPDFPPTEIDGVNFGSHKNPHKLTRKEQGPCFQFRRKIVITLRGNNKSLVLLQGNSKAHVFVRRFYEEGMQIPITRNPKPQVL